MRFRLLPSPGAAAALASAAILFAVPAPAQDCQLRIRALKNVLMPGQSTDVHVLARFSPSAYAFASAQFRVLADAPAWTFASGGAIAGNDVVNIDVQQAHQPWLGVFADPRNPLRIWRGTFQPTSWAPQLVALETSPIGISIYPSKLTSSSVPCTPQRDLDWIAVNPLPVWRSGVVPGLGTTIVRTGPNEIRADAPSGNAIVALVLPPIHPAAAYVRTTIAPAQPLERLTMTVAPQRNGGDDMPLEEVSFAFSPTSVSPTSGIRVAWAEAIRYEFHAKRGGAVVRVFSGTTNELPFPLPVLPATFGTRDEFDPVARETRVIGLARFEAPQRFAVPGGPAFVCDVLEVHAVRGGIQKFGSRLLILQADSSAGHPGGANFHFADGHVHF